MDQVRFPLRIDGRGRTATGPYEQYVEDLLEQLLFTNAGERVNRPDFGSGLMQLVFQPNSVELAAATEFLVQGSLQHWLGDLISVDLVDVQAEDSTLRVTVRYTVRRSEARATAQFTRGGVS